MKLGILTFHRPSNFGANLQAYSSCQYLKKRGHDVIIIDYTRNVDDNYKQSVVSEQFLAHKKFVESQLPLSRQVFDQEGLCDIVVEERFDAILIGADAVWRKPTDGCIYFAQWLFSKPEFINVKVASISPAHMGNGFEGLNEDVISSIQQCLSRFSYITVRDEWTKNVINRDIFGGMEFVKNINPDPVITLHRFVDNSKWQSNGIKEDCYIAMTLPADWSGNSKLRSIRIKWFNRFKEKANNSGLKLVELPLPEGKSGMPFDYVVDYPIDSLQWFLWIRNAKAFCGMRFHAIVSSISSGTPFYSIDYYGDSSRLNMLLDVLGFHRVARRYDTKSKIRNLLLGSPFEKNRTGRFIEFESPDKVFNLLVTTSRLVVEDFRDQLEKTFDENMKALEKSLEK